MCFFTQVQNRLIINLPHFIKQGYRLTKAVRILQLIYPIISQLICLGVTNDITEIIRSHMLKTGVFILTQKYKHTKDIQNISKWHWAIIIYTKLRELVIIGNTKEFFQTRRYIFEGRPHGEVECEHLKQTSWLTYRNTDAVVYVKLDWWSSISFWKCYVLVRSGFIVMEAMQFQWKYSCTHVVPRFRNGNSSRQQLKGELTQCENNK